jgi:hypothetical protein
VSSERRRPLALGLAGLLVAGALAAGAAACAGPQPTPAFTAYPIGPTAWPNGTTGQYGLYIDPSLLARLPQTVDAYPIVEDAASEIEAMDDSGLSNTFDRYAAASIGQVGEPDWLYLAIGHFKPAMQSPDVYPDVLAAWISQYATGACSQANAVATTNQETINSWLVDEATCAGGVFVYTLPLGDGTVLSMFGAGPKGLGRQLIEALY